VSHYLAHLLAWSLPVLVAQWAVFARLLWANARAVAGATVVVTAWLLVADEVAIGAGVWRFGREYIAGVFVGAVPIEEALFFALTSLLVTQSLVLFLPRGLKRVPEGCRGWKYEGL
jgi:lycopene cyclase domain-containing protein